MTLVVDASVVASLALSDEDASLANAVLATIEREGKALVPPVFWDELRNVLVMAERRGRLSAPESDEFFADLQRAAHLQTSQATDPLAPMQLARQFQLSVYDETYLALAMETQSSLATHDAALRAAAVAASVSLISDP